ncbi:MAG: 30S ribosomal protein S16 [Planctomycetes bacterium]|nr:30S ribosomal protein S16 [Planctomycetota bacterium]
MSVRIRLRRAGRHRRPFYRIVVTDIRVKRDGKYIESLGWYDPLAHDEHKRLKFNLEKAKEWIEKGAQPSERVKSFFKNAGFTLTHKRKSRPRGSSATTGS